MDQFKGLMASMPKGELDGKFSKIFNGYQPLNRRPSSEVSTNSQFSEEFR